MCPFPPGWPIEFRVAWPKQTTGSREQGLQREFGIGMRPSDDLVNRQSARPLRFEKQAQRFSRRRLLFGFAALSAAAALLAAVWIQTHPSRHDTPNSVLEEAMDFFGTG